MKTFNDFITDQGNYPVVRSFVRKMLECGIDPAKYVYYRLVEGVPMQPAAAASAAPGMVPNQQAVQAPSGAPTQPPAQPGMAVANNPQQDVQGLTKMVNQMMLKYSQTSPELGKLLNNLGQEATKLQGAAQQDAQKRTAGATGQPQQGQAQPGTPAPPLGAGMAQAQPAKQ